MREAEWRVAYWEDGVQVQLPRLADQLIRRSTEASVAISLDVAGLDIRGHVFAEDWIEFDVPARDIAGQRELDALGAFVAELGAVLDKEVRATPEAAHDAPIFTYEPGDGVGHLA